MRCLRLEEERSPRFCYFSLKCPQKLLIEVTEFYTGSCFEFQTFVLVKLFQK